MAHLKDITNLHNRYFIMRHGQSEANVAGLITSDPAECVQHYGLTKHGKEQATVSAKDAKQKGWLSAETIICSSDFKRAMETARIAQTVLGAAKVNVSPALRERFFGAYDGKRADKYIEIWARDRQEATLQRQNGVESVGAILGRLTNFIKGLEAHYQDKCLLLVSHGDPLQVLQAAFAGHGPEEGRSIKYIEPAEIRRLKLVPVRMSQT